MYTSRRQRNAEFGLRILESPAPNRASQRRRAPGYVTAAAPFVARAVGAARKWLKDKKNPSRVVDSMGQSKRVQPPRRPNVMGSSRAPTMKNLSKKVKNMQCLLNASEGELVYRSRSTGALIAGVKAQNALALGAFSGPYYETVLGQLRYYDPTAPSALVTADGTSGTYAKSFCFTSNYAKLALRNNYQVPVKVCVYYCQVKADTAIDPLTAWSNGVADNSNVSYTSVLSYPTDSDQFNSVWTLQKTDKKQLEPGETLECIHVVPLFDYNPAVADSQTEGYRREDKGFAFLISVQGITGHDTALAQYTSLSCGIDYTLDRTTKVKYDAGGNVKYIYATDGSTAAFTNSGVVSMKPLADNLGYSVS